MRISSSESIRHQLRRPNGLDMQLTRLGFSVVLVALLVVCLTSFRTATATTQYTVTFASSGLGGDATGTTLVSLTPSGGSCTGVTIPLLGGSVNCDDGTSLAFSFTNLVTSSVTGKQYRFVSAGNTSPISVTAQVAVTGTYMTQWKQTFQVSANVVDATGTVVTVNSVPMAAGSMPYSVWVDQGSTVTYSYADPLSSTVTGKRYTLTSPVPSPPSGYSVDGTTNNVVTITGTYQTQYQVTFATGGIGSDSSGTVVTVNGLAETQSQLTSTTASTITYTFTQTVPSTTVGKQYVLTAVSGGTPAQSAASATFSPSAPGTITATYKIQYLLTLAVDPPTLSSSSITPAVGDYWEDSSSQVSIFTNPVSGYTFSSWSGSGPGSYTGPSSSASITMNGVIAEWASFTANSAWIALNPSSGQVGTIVQVSGSGFLASDNICSLSGYPGTTAVCTVSSGTLTATFAVGNFPSRPYTITATGSSDSAEATFTVTSGSSVASIALNPNSGPVGSGVTITGSGFNVADTYCSITSSLGASMISNAACTMSGGVITYARFTVGAVATAGSYAIITLTDSSGDSATATFTVTGSQTTVAVVFEEDGLGSDAIGNVIQIDGAWYDYQQLAAGVTLSWPIVSTHTISANTLISGTNGNQYNFEYWSDDGASTHTITVTGAAEYVAYYSPTSSGQVNNEITITETTRITTTSLATVTQTTTGYVTTQTSSVTTSETLYTTKLQTSYGTITVTTYIYIESNSPSQELANATNPNSTNGGSLLQQLSQQLLQQLSPLLQLARPTVNLSGPWKFMPIAIAGAGVVAGASVIVRRRRHGNKKGPEEGSAGVGSGEIDGRVMDYIAAHQGAISMGQATEDLGISAKDLTGAIEKLKSDGRLKAT